MSINLRLGIFAVALIIIIIILQILKRGKVPIKYSLVWFLSTIIMLLVAFLPDFLITIAKIIGFETMSNMVIGVMIIILFFISMALTIIVSGQKEKITLLIQEVSILKRKVEEDEKK